MQCYASLLYILYVKNIAILYGIYSTNVYIQFTNKTIKFDKSLRTIMIVLHLIEVKHNI